MKCVIEFLNPWEQRWQRWNMEPVGEDETCFLMFDRTWSDASLKRRVVEVAP